MIREGNGVILSIGNVKAHVGRCKQHFFGYVTPTSFLLPQDDRQREQPTFSRVTSNVLNGSVFQRVLSAYSSEKFDASWTYKKYMFLYALLKM